MKTLSRYIVKIFLKNFLLSLVGLTAIYLLQDILSEILGESYPVHQIVIHRLMGAPTVAVLLAPPAMLMATLLTLSGFARTNELVAMFSIGIGLRQIVSVLLSVAFMVSCFFLVLQDRILPPLFQRQTTYYWRVMKNRPDFYLDVKRDKIWYRSNNFIYNIQTVDPLSKNIIGMSIYEFDGNFVVKKVMEAKQATYKKDRWFLKDGTVTVFTGPRRVPSTDQFDHLEVLLDEKPSDFMDIEREVDGLRLKELFAYIQKMKRAGVDTKAYEVKFHSRLGMSFASMVMCLLAVPFSTRQRRQQGSLARDMGICLVFTFFYWLFYSIGLSLGKNGSIPPAPAAWLSSIIFAIIAGGLIARQTQER